MKQKHILALIVCFIIPLVFGGISGLLTADNIPSWYAFLNKPAFNPPDYLFGPVWTGLYLLMGLSLFLIWRSSPGVRRNQALVIFGAQLVLNFSWTFIFFHFRQPGWAFFEIVLVWIAVLAMILFFYRISKTAALLQIPYILWVSFASVLNGMIWWLN
jgi:translocator protein